MMSLPRSLSSEWVGTFDCCPFSHTLEQEWQGNVPAKGEGPWLGRGPQHGHTMGEGHMC